MSLGRMTPIRLSQIVTDCDDGDGDHDDGGDDDNNDGGDDDDNNDGADDDGRMGMEG